MASQIDFVIAAGLFLVFLGVIISFLLNFLSNYFNISLLSELRVLANNLYNTLFGSKGIPANWWNSTNLPVKIGLVNDLYRRPIRVVETSGSLRNNITINVTVLFDETCDNKAWETTIRLFDFNGTQINMKLYNQTYCIASFIKQANVLFNVTLQPSSTNFFYLYYSPENSIAPSNSSLEFNSTTPNIIKTVYPEEKLQTISIDRLKALRNLTYDQVVQILGGSNRNFRIEVSDT